MAEKRPLAFLKWLDFFNKSADELNVRTTAGAIVTFIATLLLVILVWNEVGNFLEPFTTDAVTVDDRSFETFRIQVDIELFGLPCNKANFDLIDDSGESSVPFVPRFDLRKDPTSQPKVPLSYCGPCEPAKGASTRKTPSWLMRDRTTCCNTCEEVKKHYAARSLDIGMAETSEQCVRERHNAAYAGTGGCRVYGSIEAPKVKANLHIAAGNSSMQAHGSHAHHVHSITQQDLKTFDISHVIHELTFGPTFPKSAAPLRGARFQAFGPTQVMYMAQVVPTTYTTVNGFKTYTAQYAASEHIRQIELKSGHLALPGLFIKYDVAPYRIHLTEEGRAFIPFLVRLCAVVGGIYATAGLLYSSIGALFSSAKKKQ